MIDRWLDRALLAVGVLCFVALAFLMYSKASEERGAARVEARIAKAQADSLRAVGLTLQAEVAGLKVQLVEAKRAAASSDRRAGAAAATYRELRDTVRIADTAAVRAVLVAADSAVNEAERSRDRFRAALAAADSVITAQARQAGALESENGALRRQVAATERQVPGRFGRALSAAKWVVVGVGVGAVLAR